MTYELFALCVIVAIGSAAIVSALLWATLPMKRNTLLDDHYNELERGE